MVHDRTRRLLFLAFGFPPALKSSSYRLREIANTFARSGWEVTVLNAEQAMWENEFGLDPSLLDDVEPSIRVIELPLTRGDLETDLRSFDEERALHPARWLAQWREANEAAFPEPTFGGWRDPLERTVLALHDEQPFDLVVVSCVPYVSLAAALRLHEERGVPFAVDFRDGWSVDVIAGGEAFAADSEPGRWERRVLEAATSLWLVNEPIAEHYRARYPELAEKVRVVRNGFDRGSVAERLPEPATAPLRFGYLGTINFKPPFVKAVLAAWREARATHPLLADATWHWHGNLGAGASRGSSEVAQLLTAARGDGVSYGGPVPKREVAALYESWDALTFMVIGGAFMTSGKVYECMASALPIVSAHEPVHDASTLLADYPLWTGVEGLDHDFLVGAFGRAAELAVSTSAEQRAAAREHAERFERSRIMREAVAWLEQRLAVGAGPEGVTR
ncbi:hypothetical protein [Nocardioides sp.]|uniref:hypothetical protein n=1 Tax=Nocardioides sp. TaxID=35761 RepID=UPI003514BCCF